MKEPGKTNPIELTGKDYWRSLDQLARTPQFTDFAEHEFPKGTLAPSGDGNNWSRRSFLTTMGASIALASLAGCRRPVEKIVPFVTRPEGVEPGIAEYFATSMPIENNAIGLLVTSREGRPIKIEGNAQHPASLGSVNPWVTASILDLYDPDRSKSILENGEKRSLDDFKSFWTAEVSQFAENGGEGLAVLCEPSSSPTMARLKNEFLRKYPNANWAVWSPIHDENVINGVRMATGRALQPVYDLAAANVICALEADIIGTETNSIVNARGFADGRRVRSQSDDMNRLYVAESALSITGAMADHRLRISSGRVAALASALTKELQSQGLTISETGDWTGSSQGSDIDAAWVSTTAKDLLAAGSKALVVAGRRLPAAVHALVVAINGALGSIGTTVRYYDVPDVSRVNTAELDRTVGRIVWERIKTLVIIGGNPVYNFPRELEGPSVFKKVNSVIHLSDYVNETSAAATWHLPRAHYLESWGDVRAVDGTMSVVQPLIRPLHGAHNDLEFLAFLTTGEWRSAYDHVRATWQRVLPSATFENKWRHVLHDGLLEGSAVESQSVRFDATSFREGIARSKDAVAAEIPTADSLEVGFYPSATWDGRYANNGWLQEMPDAMTKLAWDNAALISPATARGLGLENGDMVQLASGPSYKLDIAVFISPGQADHTIALPLGYGRTRAGKIGDGVGFDTYLLRQFHHQYFLPKVTLTRLNRTYTLASTQDHGSMEGRPIVRENTLAGYKEDIKFFPLETKHPPLVPLWEPHSYAQGYQWGMSIDLNACIGCNACVVACQSENNIPVVGKEQVFNGREMHWMRLDRYYAGDTDNPEVMVQPMNCQHCENAPCESVCPVNATVHDDEGLNVMIYNRCIGTRYCSNNCPFKVRRFNFFNYTNNFSDEHKMVQNPEVTVRFRGVMEKCTYCLHRISTTKQKAKVEGRQIEDGELVTACQQACPTKAIVFGNINDPNSEVTRLRNNNRAYHVLREYNLKTRTTYLAKLRNPHPDLAKPLPYGPKNGSGHSGSNGDNSHG